MKNKERHKWISVAAFYIAEKRKFTPGFELDDWLEAERNYTEMLISSSIMVMEEDGGVTNTGLQRLAKEIGVPNFEALESKIDLIRAIQNYSGTRSCFQHDPHNPCDFITDCYWKTECKKLIAIWKRH